MNPTVTSSSQTNDVIAEFTKPLAVLLEVNIKYDKST
uniref:Uncharacterized protein n=1 Tax=Lepeophtheirus salmonis TaxID=72036 RepID=A0A0K2V1F2_LEPSM